MSARLGRPKKDITRTVLIGARFTPEEAERIGAAVGGGNKSDWIRAMLLGAGGQESLSEASEPSKEPVLPSIYEPSETGFLD